jgi:ankyrin repeat protein
MKIDTAVYFSDISAVRDCLSRGEKCGLHEAIRQGDLSIIKLLIASGSDINKRNLLGYTPLHVACLNDDVEVVRYLLDIGADIRIKTAAGFSSIVLSEISGCTLVSEFFSDCLGRLFSFGV